MKTRILAAVLAAMLLLSCLSGCGAATASTAESAASSAAAESSDGVITLTFPCIWVGSDSKAEVFGKMVEDFNTEYAGQYQVVIEEQTDYDLYEDKLRTQITTGDAPDIFTVKDFSDVELYAESGKLMDLTAFLTGDDIAPLFIDGAVEAAQVGGVSYAFPYENAVVPIMFNRSLLESAGITEIPTSFEELFEVAATLQENGIYAFTQSTADNAWFAMLWYSYALAACGGENVYDNGLDDPAFVEAAELVQKMFEYTSSDAIGADATVANGHFFNERSAMYLNGTWILGRIKSEGVEGLYDNLAVSTGLSYNGQNGGAYINQVQAYLCAAKQDDPAKQAAVEAFFTYILNPDRVGELCASSGSLFAVNVDASVISDPVQAEIVAQSSSASFTIGHFNGSMSTAVAAEFPSALEALILGDTTPEEFVEQLKAADK